MIILEGADGSGKSTLKKAILNTFTSLLDVSLTKLDPIKARQDMALKKDTYNCLTDRSFFISELVYSQVLREYKVPATIWAPLYRELYKDHLVIICTGCGKDVRKAWDSDEEVWQKTQDTKAQARAIYAAIAEELGCPTYDFEVDSVDKVINLVRNYIS